jgi:hypothetical protein
MHGGPRIQVDPRRTDYLDESTGGERVSGGSNNAAGELGAATGALRRRVARGRDDSSGSNNGDSGSNIDLDPVAGPEAVKGAPPAAANGAPVPEILIK